MAYATANHSKVCDRFVLSISVAKTSMSMAVYQGLTNDLDEISTARPSHENDPRAVAILHDSIAMMLWDARIADDQLHIKTMLSMLKFDRRNLSDVTSKTEIRMSDGEIKDDWKRTSSLSFRLTNAVQDELAN